MTFNVMHLLMTLGSICNVEHLGAMSSEWRLNWTLDLVMAEKERVEKTDDS